MDFRATRFKGFDALDPRLQTRLHALFGEDDSVIAWNQLTNDHDDQAANVLAVTAALVRVTVVAGDRHLPAFELIELFHLLTGDRLYSRLNGTLFDAWKRTGRFAIARADGEREEGRVTFNRGQLGASLHRGFDIQGVTALNRIPRIQWNYRNCDSLADIDIDGFSPWDVAHHLTYANSDPRQWYDRFQAKFGNAGFEVDRVGNVPELKIEDTSSCPRPERQLTPQEQAAALATVSRIAQTLAAADDFRDVIERAVPTVMPALRDAEQSPLASEVGAGVLAEATDSDLLGYYAARVNVDRLMRISPFRERPRAEATVPLSANDLTGRTVTTVDELKAVREALESEEGRQRARVRATDRSLVEAIAPPLSAHAWLSTTDTPAFGYPPGTRFVAAETADLQLLLAPGPRGYELVFAVPRTKY